ncbi:MAG: alanine racemase [Bacteroidia bacterium]|nr:alanine racemase [Bacteroidia bacterium]MDW8134301.1 alanine racemase [Bacteroidia bacterium]
MKWEDNYLRYTMALREIPRPAAFVDMQALETNAQKVLEYAGRLPIRIATKSIRCLYLLKYIRQLSERFCGFLCMSAREALYLAREGLDDFVIGYPFFQPAEQLAYLELVRMGKKAVAMVDSIEQAEALHHTFQGTSYKASLCLDIDVSSDWGWLYFGVRRSPLRSVEEVVRFAQVLRRLDRVEVVGMMAYEAQIAGVGDKGIGWKGLLLRYLKGLSWQEVVEKRRLVVEALKEMGFSLQFVNGGGTGSLSETAKDPVVTEVTAGSAFFAPALFDYYEKVSFMPAAGFSLEIVRRPAEEIYTCHGGGYIASGAVSSEKLPKPWLPPHMRFLKHEGAGEIQTPVYIPNPPSFLRIGEPLYFRHAKSGELSQHFPYLYLLRGERIEAKVPTYASLAEVWV